MALDPRELEQFFTMAQMKLPGASVAGIKTEFFDVCKEFLGDSNAWTENIYFQPIAGTLTYLITPKEEGQIIRLNGVFDNNLISVPAFMPDFATVLLLNAPNTTPPTQFFARVAKNVVLPTTRDMVPIVPDWLLRVYSLHLLDGLIGKMMATENTSYSNDTKSTYHLRRFRTGIQLARTAAIRQNLMGAQEWAYPRGWNASSQRGGVSTAWPTRAF